MFVCKVFGNVLLYFCFVFLNCDCIIYFWWDGNIDFWFLNVNVKVFLEYLEVIKGGD